MKGLRTITELIKVRLSLAVTLSAATGYFVSGSAGFMRLAGICAGVFFLAAGSSAINQYMERHSDGKMTRTMKRPFPAGSVSTQGALSLSAVMLVTGSVILALTGVFPFLLGAAAVMVYTQIYTRLKPHSVLAVIPGAMVGAIPPFIGYTAAGTEQISTEILILGSFLFLWQIPHFWLITLNFADDYRSAGFKIITDRIPEKQVRYLIFTWILLIVAILSFYVVSGIYFTGYIVYLFLTFNAIFLVFFSLKFFMSTGPSSAYITFRIMNIYNLGVFIFFIIQSLIPAGRGNNF